jgi:hypothetical protein
MIKESGKPFADASLNYQEMIRKLKPLSLWKDLKFPPYFLVSDPVQQKVGA